MLVNPRNDPRPVSNGRIEASRVTQQVPLVTVGVKFRENAVAADTVVFAVTALKLTPSEIVEAAAETIADARVVEL